MTTNPLAPGRKVWGGVMENFLGTVVNAGPNGEPDFTDARYWVRRPSGDIGEAVNLSEIGESSRGVSDGETVTCAIGGITVFNRPIA